MSRKLSLHRGRVQTKRLSLFALLLGAGLALAVPSAIVLGPSTAEAKKKRKKRRKSKKKRKKSSSGLSKPQKGLSLGQVAKQQKSPERTRIDGAIRDFKEERYAVAAVTLYDVSTTESVPAPLRDEAEYHLAKSLYRLKLNHSALNHFTSILERGPDSPFYGPALEWCLFIARRIVADDRVLESVARYAPGSFPEEYADEFNYLLSKYHYVKALALEAAGDVASSGKARVEETTTGGKSFKGDVFGDVFADDPEEDEEPERSGKITRKDEGGFSLGEDIFGDEEEEEPPPPPKKKSAKKKASKAPSADGDLTPDEHVEAAGRLVVKVKRNSTFAARAKFLEAVLLYRGGQDNDALEAFKSVVRMTKEGAPHADPALRQLAFFQLARTHFGARQPSFSLYYYDKMQRFTEEWLGALYESSWAEFRLGNYEKALGNLLTLHSPFFVEEYFPESLVLKAVVYYENCRYAEAKDILTRFLERYEPVLDELNKLTARDRAAEKYYEILSNLRDGQSVEASSDRAAIMSQILTLALTDSELEKLDGAYVEIDRELKSLGDKGAVLARSDLKAHLFEVLSDVRGEVQRQAGRAAKRKLLRERDAIKKLVGQALRIEIETAAAERKRIEATLRGVETTVKRRENEFVEWADDEKLVWPFDNEYWRDELGTYQLTLAETCRARGGAQFATSDK